MNKIFKRKNSEDGFTLLEVMVVAAILSAGMLVVAANYPFGANHSNLHLLGMEIASKLRATRDFAQTNNDKAAFVFDAENRTYQVTEHGKRFGLPEDISFKLMGANQIISRPQEGRIVFFGDSSSTGGVVVLAKGHAKFQIDVDWLTGSISIARGSQ